MAVVQNPFVEPNPFESVEERLPISHPEEQQPCSSKSVENHLKCFICRHEDEWDKGEDSNFVICDVCDSSFHVSCLIAQVGLEYTCVYCQSICNHLSSSESESCDSDTDTDSDYETDTDEEIAVD